MNRLAIGLLTTALFASVGVTFPGAPAGAVASPGSAHGWAFGQGALDRIGDRLPEVATANGMNPGQLQRLFLSDGTLAVDDAGGLAYFDVLAPGERSAPTAPADEPAAAPPLTDPVFQLASLPGADKTIYLDFDGHVTEGTTWNSASGITTITSPPYDTELASNPDSWSSSELDVIRKSWETVAEDYAPWNINVTTIDPGIEALRYSGPGDTEWGARVVITDDTFANCGCGGHAYVGSFSDNTDTPTFVYNSSLVGVKEAISHEVGHMLLLAHDGSSTAGYYEGHGSGATSWAPIMGVGYYVSVSQWSQQEYYGAKNTGSSANYGNGADDIAIISSLTNGNGFGLKPDDHGNDPASATPLSDGSPTVTGIVGSRADVDVFSFSAGAGTISFSAVPAATSPNLDIELTLRNDTGQVVAVANPASELTASLSVPVLTAGTYSVEIDGVGVGTPGANPPSGYSDYASLGQYTLSGTIPAAGPPDDVPPAQPATPSISGVAEDHVTFAWTPNGETDLASYQVLRSTGPSGPEEVGEVAAGTESFTDTSVAANTAYSYVLTATDTSNNVSVHSGSVSATTPAAAPRPDTATAGTLVSGTVTGSLADTATFDGVHQTITEVSSGGRRSRYDSAEYRWEIPVTSGNNILELDATVVAGSDADTGFNLEWSADGTTWNAAGILSGTVRLIESLTVSNGDTLYVRIRDDNRAAGNYSLDAIAVDRLALTGGEPPTEAPAKATNPSPTDVATEVPTSPTLTWNPSDGATGYTVTVTQGETTVVSDTVTASFALSGLAPATQYTWRVDATNSLGTTAGDTWTFTTSSTPVATSFTATLTTSTSGGRSKNGVATVVLTDDLGNPIVEASVTVTFVGNVGNGNQSGTTNEFGSVTITSSQTDRKPSFSACVESVIGTTLTYDTGSEACTP
ncbi:MAG: hypothetical protein ACI8Y4_005250 [Candidatus Poriferisodalaceae bacterium]|jgi:hypothetical protein